MIRIVEVLATLKRAGAEVMATSLACGLDRSRFSTAVVSLYDAFPNGLEPHLSSCGVPWVYLGKRHGLDLRMYPRLRAAFRELQPDIVHTHSYVMRYVLPVSPCPIVHTVHNVAGREVDVAGKWIHRIGFRSGAVPVAVAGEVARSFQRVYGFEAQVIPNGIDTAQFAQPRPERSGPVTIVSVARLDPQKNPGMLVQAKPPGCRLLLAGDGSLRSEFEKAPGVQLLGVCSDVAGLLARADIFALASNWEGHPIAVMEAMAAGLPVVATAVGGVPEIVGDAGVLIPPGDTPAMAAALERLAADQQMRAEFGARARERAQRFDIARMIDAYAALFEQVVRR